MKYFRNRYFSSDDKAFVSIPNEAPKPERMKMIKLNNAFAFTIFSNIITKEDFVNEPLMRKYMPTILLGKLARNDNVTGHNTRKLGEKLKFLVEYCNGQPEHVEQFKRSFFAQAILKPFYDGGFSGGLDLTAERWELYEKNTTDPVLKPLDALNGAIKCYLTDPEAPVGLDMSKLIDGLVETDENGEYKFVSDFKDLKVKEEMVKSMEMFINLLKGTKRFKANYHNPNIIEAEPENE